MNLQLYIVYNRFLKQENKTFVNGYTKKQNACMHKCLPLLFILIIFFTGFPSFIIAQTTLPSYVDTKPGVVDYVVPSDIVHMYISVAGAQGGNVESPCIYQGGQGAYFYFELSVGFCSPQQIVPGGILRLITGAQGQSIRTPYDVAGGGGGGGGSALLYKAPSSSDWVILIAAGGGGGAGYSDAFGPCTGADGLTAQLWSGNGTNGTQTDVTDNNCIPGTGGSNGNGGSDRLAGFYAGGGAYSDGTTTGSQDCTGKKGLPNGGAAGNCNAIFTVPGGFGFGSGGAGTNSGGGGGGYSGGGAPACEGEGGGGGGSYYSYLVLKGWGFKSGDGEITILSGTGTPTPPISLASSTLPAQQVLGCSLANCADFGYSTTETGTTLQKFTAAGGKIVSGGCSVDTITYHDSAANENPIRTVYRTFTVTDGGNNKAVAKQTINITDPGIAATLTPSSQVVCGNVKPATITANVTSQFGITVQWYQGDNAIFSNATIIPGATSVSYSPPATSIAGVTYYFIKMTDGCGSITVKNATVTVGQAVTWYKDFDNDGYYDPLYIGQPTCQSPGAGYKSTGLLGEDCNDNDATINPQTVWVHDADGDGYYSGSPYTGCLAIGATGFVKFTNQLPGDCNDSNASIHPGATEVLNGKDDNCDGKIDEGLCGVTSNLRAVNITDSSATINWDSALNGIKYNLSYKAANVSTWTVVKNINATNYNLTNLPLYYTYNYKVQTVCPYNDKSAYSTASKFNTTYGGPVYCVTKGNTYYEYIKKVVLGTAINNTSGDNNGYGDYNGLNATVSAGGSYQIKLTPGFHSAIDTEYWEVYVDYNHDGVFGKSSERVATGKSKGVLTRNFTIPLTAKNGFTRMRIMMHYDSALNNPCGNFINGEAEDYTLIITGGTAAIVLANGGTQENAQASGLSSIVVVPNPVGASSATVELNMIKEGSATLSITDMSGRTLYKKEVTSLHAGNNEVALNQLSTLPNGVYMVEATQNGVPIGRGKVVVSK